MNCGKFSIGMSLPAALWLAPPAWAAEALSSVELDSPPEKHHDQNPSYDRTFCVPYSHIDAAVLSDEGVFEQLVVDLANEFAVSENRVTRKVVHKTLCAPCPCKIQDDRR